MKNEIGKKSGTSEGEKLLNIFQKATKKLVPPTAMVVAAVVVSKGLTVDPENGTVLRAVIWMLMLSSLGYLLVSTGVMVCQIDRLKYGWIRKAPLALVAILVYFVMAAAGISLTVGRLTGFLAA